MLPDFLLNLVANLVWEWIRTISRVLRNLGFGNTQSRTLQSATRFTLLPIRLWEVR